MSQLSKNKIKKLEALYVGLMFFYFTPMSNTTFSEYSEREYKLYKSMYNYIFFLMKDSIKLFSLYSAYNETKRKNGVNVKLI